jgi:uncharacterized membrane-anchored protein
MASSVGEIFRKNWKKYAVTTGVIIAFVGGALMVTKYFFNEKRMQQQ